MTLRGSHLRFNALGHPILHVGSATVHICRSGGTLDRVSADRRACLDPGDLLVLLTVARRGRFTAAAQELGVNHTTVSRRVAALERAVGGRVLMLTGIGWELTELGRELLGPAEAIETALEAVAQRRTGSIRLTGTVRVASPDGFAIHVLVPAVAALQAEHPDLDVEVVTATQRARQARSGVDIEVVVGHPQVRRAGVEHLKDYALRLYATEAYLDRAGSPVSVADLRMHRLVYYIDSALQVDDLDEAARRLPTPRSSLRSTSVFAHVAAVLADAGIGLLPDFMAAGESGLKPVLPEFAHHTSYWAITRTESQRSTAVRNVLAALVAASGQPQAD